MVAGLAFLSKKSWHTKNISNQERVWVAEQRKEQEESKAKELAKQIAQEREQEEMDKIAGKKSARIDRGIDWMYHGQQKNSEIAQEDAAKKSEEYLLGKAYAPESQAVGDFDASAQLKEGVNAVVELKKPPPQKEPAYKEPTVADRNEAFRMRHEDPMFQVAMEAKHKQDEYKKKKELYERVVGVRGDDDDNADERDHKSRKKEKKHKKKKKHRKRHYYSSDEDDSSSLEDRKRHHTKRHKRSRTPESHEDRSRRHHRRSHSRERDEYSARRGDRDDRHHHRRRHNRHDDYSDDDSYDPRDRRGRQDRYRSRSPEYSRDKTRSHDPDLRDGRGNLQDWHPRSEEALAQEKKAGYGLQGKTLKSPPSDLGPDRELLRKKRQERGEQIERNRQQSSRRNMTEAEREAALREMKESAARHHQSRRADRPDDEDEVRHDPQSSAAFLHSVARKAHGVSEGSMSLHERISQNRSTNQRLHDDFV
uniref:CBF1-interacting co-repressor CIR N-terminal domain-containing protein n=1 Tax=Amphora coffeiformis TaxID=265554 RepID=A0A7S3L9T5_9STRA|mmetsp:Transcript_32/g.54  ORF Transcript_32/g.54 Transcript_32/m.54 type:complete len:479 (+) Transcript_32:197-1633(+)|eukprot:scaffold16707_cov182-Amphora_coffeaeformis.AAC.7